MALADTGTLLVITPAQGSTPVLVPFSARGLTQTLEPIQAANIRRTINGELIDLTPPQFRKYQSTITCTDFASPALDGAFAGKIVTVDCVAELSYPTSGGSPARPVVTDSSRVSGANTFYRPQLTMIVMEIRNSLDEWGAEYTWQVDLQEV